MIHTYLTKVLSNPNRDISERMKLQYQIVWYSAICHELYMKYREMKKNYVIIKTDEFINDLQRYEEFKQNAEDIVILNDRFINTEELKDFCEKVKSQSENMLCSFIHAMCHSEKIVERTKKFVIFEANCRLRDYILAERFDEWICKIYRKIRRRCRRR